MRRTVLVAFVAAALAAPAVAQDSKVKSRTDIKADDAKVISMMGCLRNDAVTHSYTLVGTVTAAGDDLTAKTTVKTDVDKDKTKVNAKSETKGNDAVATAGAVSTYFLLAAPAVNLAPHVGQQVRISALQVEKGHGDADVKVKDQTKVERENAPDSKSTSKTKVELEKSPNAAYTVVTVTPLGMACAQ
jgi:hypothetical protein